MVNMCNALQNINQSFAGVNLEKVHNFTINVVTHFSVKWPTHNQSLKSQWTWSRLSNSLQVCLKNAFKHLLPFFSNRSLKNMENKSSLVISSTSAVWSYEHKVKNQIKMKSITSIQIQTKKHKIFFLINSFKLKHYIVLWL